MNKHTSTLSTALYKTLKILFVLLTVMTFSGLFAFTSKSASVPATPGSAHAEVRAANQVYISWTDRSNDETGFRVYRKTDAVTTYSLIYTSGSNTTSYTDYGVSVGRTYTYRIVAYNSSGESTTAQTDTVAVIAPNSLTVTPISQTSMQLEFTYAEYSYLSGQSFSTIIERRRSDSSTWVQIGETAPGIWKYTDTTVVENYMYYYRLRAKYNNTVNQYTYPLYSSGTGGYSLLNPPSSLTAQIVSGNTIRLTWTDNTTKETGYRLERSVNGSDYVYIKTLQANVVTTDDMTISSGNSYQYRVRAYNSTTHSAYVNSDPVNFFVPIHMTLTAVSSEQITVNWDYPSHAEAFNLKDCTTIIQRRDRNSSVWVEIGKTEGGETVFRDTSLLPGELYYYRLIPMYKNTVISNYTFPNDQIGIGRYTLLTTPTGFYGYAKTANAISLAWDYMGDHIVYDIERQTGEDGFITLKTNHKESTYLDTYVVDQNKTYTYRITAKTSATQSPPSYTITIMAETLESIPELKVQNINSKAAYLTWVDSSSRETGMELWRKTSSKGTWELYRNLPKNTVMYLDDNIQTGVDYQYKLRAVKNEKVFSEFTNTVSMSTINPQAPNILAYRPISYTEYLFKWEDISDTETEYQLHYMEKNSSTWKLGATMPTDSFLLVWNPPVKDTWYDVRIRAYNSHSNSGMYTNTVTLYFGKPQAPKINKAEHLSRDSIKVSWSSTTANETEYLLERKASYENTYKQIAHLKATVPGDLVTEFVDSEVVLNTTYSYRVRSKNYLGVSDYSSVYNIPTSIIQTFSDLSNKHWAYDQVDFLYKRGLINGVGNGKFAPDRTVTRAEFVKLVIETFKLKSTPVGSFADVNPGHWYYSYVMTAQFYAVVPGGPKDYFRPNMPITREEMAVIVYNALCAVDVSFTGYPDSVLDKFSDKSAVASTAIPAFSVLCGNEIITGTSSGTQLAPKRTLTRAEAVSVIYKIVMKYDIGWIE